MPGDEAGQPFPAADGPMYGLLLSEVGWESKKEVLFFYFEKGIQLLPTRCHGWVWVDVGTHSAAKLSRLLGATPYESKPGINFHDLKAKS